MAPARSLKSGRAAAEEALEEIRDHLAGIHMVFVTAGMGGGTGTGAAPVIARTARDMGILTVGVVTKPFQFEGMRRMRIADQGINELQKSVDTLIVIPNQNLFRVANEKTTFADAFSMADQVLYSGVACITDLMVKEGLINLDFADVRAIMREMGKAMMGTGEASGERRAILAAEAAIANPLLDETSMRGARGLLISITGGNDLTLYEVDEAASRIREEVDEDANIILGATFDERLDGIVRVSVVATGIDTPVREMIAAESRIAEAAQKLRSQVAAAAAPAAAPAPAPRAEPAAYEQAYEQPAAPAYAAHEEQQYSAPQPTRYAQQPQVAHEVMIEPIQPKAPPSLLAQAPQPQHEPAYEADRHFMPPVPEPVVRGARMPTIDDLPAPGRAILAAQQGGGDPTESTPPVSARAPRRLQPARVRRHSAGGACLRPGSRGARACAPSPGADASAARAGPASAARRRARRIRSPPPGARSGGPPAAARFSRPGGSRSAARRGRPSRDSGLPAAAIELKSTRAASLQSPAPASGAGPYVSEILTKSYLITRLARV